MARRKRSWETPALVLVLVLILSLGLVLAGCGAASSEQVALKYSYNPGDSWAYDMTVAISGSASGFEGQDTDESVIPEDMTTKLRVTYTVDDVSDEITTLTLDYELVEATAGGEPVEPQALDSQSVTMKIDSAGRIVSVEGTGQAGLGALGESGMPFDPTELTNQFSVLFPESGLGEVGDEWSIDSSFPIPGLGQEITATTKAKLVAVEIIDGREMATIDYTVTVPMDVELDLGAMLEGLMQGLGGEDQPTLAFKMSLGGTFDFAGTAKIDTADGRTVSITGVETLALDMEITEAPDEIVPADERGPFSIDMTIDVTMTEAK